MKKKTLGLLAVLTLFLTVGCGNPKLKNGEEVIAKIDGKEYSANELYEELKGQYGYNVVMNWIDSAIAEKEVKTTKEIESYADEAITYYTQYATSYGMTLPNFAASYLGISGIESEDDLKEYIIKDRKLTIAIQNQIISKLKDSEVKDFYDDNYKKVYTYREILIANDDDADDKIKDIKKELKDKKDDKLVDKFEELAEKHSTSATAEDGGLVKSATKNKVNEKVWKELEELDDEEYSDKIETDNGYYIILRISKDKAKDLEDVEEEIKTTLAENKLQADQFLSYEILTELRNKYKLAFFDEELKEDYNSFLDEVEKAKKEAEKAAKDKEEDKEEDKDKEEK